MKQILPLVLIAALIAVAIVYFQDPEEEAETEEPYWETNLTSNQNDNEWEMIVFLDEGEDGADIGVQLEYQLEPRELEKFEFTFLIDKPANGFFVKETELEDFDGTFEYREACDFCSDPARFTETGLNTKVRLTWNAGGETHSTSIGGQPIPVRALMAFEEEQ
ncbi:hypothetical protein CR205_14970 [Alteribacter lacisalsi]|uniref:Uncharacterized protein n=2 Tax=Alteribacter lacisalsi TaxID=2045244 RepID=A0A2W0HJ10_9BACI|nr:hypothetical protein CR205_14970 [Alteribacter lacisalsi]